MNRKVIALILVIVLIANLVLFSFHAIDYKVFWSILIAVCLIYYFWFRKKR